MVGAILTNKAPVTLKEVTPIARLTGEYEAIVVPASSPLKTIGDLVDQLKRSGQRVTGRRLGRRHRSYRCWPDRQGGRRRSDQDQLHRLFRRRRSACLDPRLAGHCRHFELRRIRKPVKAGTLRLLAVSSEEKLEGVDAPTLKESGLDVVVQNWRMVAAPPGLTPEQEKAVSADIEKLAKSAKWQETLKTKSWMDTYLSGDEFKAQLAKDTDATAAILKEIGLVK